MNTTDYLVSSDLASGAIAVVLGKLSCRSVSNANLWKPFVESMIMSIIGRMGEDSLTGKSFSRSGATATTQGEPYLRTEEARSSLIIFISSMVLAYVMKSKNMYENGMLNVTADVLGSQLTQALFATDTVWYSKTVQPK